MDTMSLPPPIKTSWKSKYFGKEVFAMKVFGLSLAGNECAAYKVYSFIFLTGTIALYPILDFCEYFKHDFSEIADIVMYQVGGVMGFCKVMVVFRNRVSFSNLLLKLEQKPFLPNLERGGNEEQKILDECVWITTIQTYVYWIAVSITIVGTFIYTSMKRLRSNDFHDWQFPYGQFTLLNATYSPNFEISYIYQCISMTFIACHFTATDLILAGVLAHISYQFKILQSNIRHVVQLSYEQMMKDAGEHQVTTPRALNSSTEIDVSVIPWFYLRNSLKRAIEYHLAIIGIAAEIEQVFSILFLFVFLGTLALICFSIYAATAIGNNSQTMVRHICECICACLQVATVCFWGEQVIHESQKVGMAVWESNFVGTDVRFQKMLTLINRRSQNPTKITAGKFAEICLSTFTWILRTSYSSFMVLRKTNADPV